MPTPSIKETISAHDEGEDLPRMAGERETFEEWYAGIWKAKTDKNQSIKELVMVVESMRSGADYDNGHGSKPPYLNNLWEGWQARASLSAAPQSDGWISVDERLPAHEQEVICTGFEGNNPAKKRWQDFAVFHDDGTFYHREEGDELYPPTHWREMFALPTTQTQGQSHGE